MENLPLLILDILAIAKYFLRGRFSKNILGYISFLVLFLFFFKSSGLAVAVCLFFAISQECLKS